MRVTVKTTEWQAALAQLGSVVARKAEDGMYKNVRLFAGGDVIKLQGIDIDTTMTLVLPSAKTDSADLDVLFEYLILNATAPSITAQELVISFTGPTEAVLSAAPSYRARLLAFPSDKFKELPVVLGINEKPDLGGYTLGLHGLKEQIELVDFAVPVAEGRHVVTCAQLASSVAGLSTTATDGVELAQSTIVYPDAGAEFSYTLPKPALDLIKKMGGGDKIKISESEGLFFFATDSEMISYSKSHAAFPNIAGILGTKGLPTAITFPNKEALNKALSRIRPLCFDKDEPAVFFEYDGATSVALVAVAEQKSTTGDTYRDMSSDVIDVTGTGPACKVKLDIKRLAPFFERATFPVTLFLKSASTVVDLHANGGTPEKSTYRFLLMPMRIPDGVSSQPIPKV